jgi:hypothetical protein
MTTAQQARGAVGRRTSGAGRRPHPDVRVPIGRRTRKATLVVHIVSAGAWIGLDVVMGVLVFTALLTDDANVRSVSLQALELFAIWPLLSAGVLCLLSGVVLSVGTKYGLVRYWWVAVKLVANVVLCTLVLFLLRPGVTEAGEIGRLISAGGQLLPPPDQMVFPPVVSTTALVAAVLLAVYKPWGRIRKRRARN